MARLLVIDDEPLVRAFVRNTLEGSGHEVSEAADGDAGLRAFEARSADLVITDIVMPGREGIETIRMLRQYDPALKIIAISGAGRVGGYDFLEIARKFGRPEALPNPLATRSS